jgi:CheY-like chemotaxis protein
MRADQDYRRVATGAARVLVVDDDALLRRMIARTLRHAGFEVVDVADGTTALTRFAGEPFDLVLLDLEMPGLGGDEVCTRLRASVTGADVPIVVLSGRDDAASIASIRACGATDFIAKPLDWRRLTGRIEELLSLRTRPQPAARVLLAGGSAELLGIGQYFHVAGDIVITVGDGSAAVESALRHDFDLVLMDCAMPTMGAADATRLLRACGYATPVVALTGVPGGGDAEEDCRAAGCTDVAFAPADRARLKQILAEQLARRRRHWGSTSALGLRLAAHTTTYRRSLPARIAAIRAALVDQQWAELATLAHTLKGTAGSFGLGQLTDLAELLEADLRAGGAESVTEACEALIREARRALDTACDEVPT